MFLLVDYHFEIANDCVLSFLAFLVIVRPPCKSQANLASVSSSNFIYISKNKTCSTNSSGNIKNSPVLKEHRKILYICQCFFRKNKRRINKFSQTFGCFHFPGGKMEKKKKSSSRKEMKITENKTTNNTKKAAKFQCVPKSLTLE